MNELEKLNKFLIELATADKIGIRRKIVILKNYLKAVGSIKDDEQ